MGWLMHFFGCLNWFMRMANDAEKVFALQEVPQEKIKGTEEPPKVWPSLG